MVTTISAYARPLSVDEALTLLGEPDAVALGGGTKLNARPPTGPVRVVDLQALPLGRIEHLDDGRLRIGATATLQALARADAVPPIVRRAATREQPSTLRAQATVGGCVATGDPESELLATLLVHAPLVELVGAGGQEVLALSDVLARLPLPAGTLVIAVTIETGGVAALASTARTCADKAIVAAAARVAGGSALIALSGVAATPIVVESTDDLEPPGDFRGSSDYRRAMARVLVARVQEEIGR